MLDVGALDTDAELKYIQAMVVARFHVGKSVRDCIAKSCQFSAAFIRDLEGDVSTVTADGTCGPRCGQEW